MWAGILLACAAVGAFIASRSNLFPPGVRDTGPVPGVSPSPSPAGPELVRWQLDDVQPDHAHLPGRRVLLEQLARARADPADGVRPRRGRVIARLRPGATCDFPSAQIQARRVVVLIVGRRDAGELDLRFREGDRRPVGIAGPGRLPQDADHAPVLDPRTSRRRSEQAEADRGSRGRDLRILHEDPASAARDEDRREALIRRPGAPESIALDEPSRRVRRPARRRDSGRGRDVDG